MRRLQRDLEGLNRRLYNPQGLNILWPKDVAFMFVRNPLHLDVTLALLMIETSWRSSTIDLYLSDF